MTAITTTNEGYGLWIAVRGEWDLGNPIGHGETEAQAIEDLRIQWMCEECDDSETTHKYRSGAVVSCLCEFHKPYWALKRG